MEDWRARHGNLGDEFMHKTAHVEAGTHRIVKIGNIGSCATYVACTATTICMEKEKQTNTGEANGAAHALGPANEIN
jgi:hypothetical protein